MNTVCQGGLTFKGRSGTRCGRDLKVFLDPPENEI
jgi:hypothetical protein